MATSRASSCNPNKSEASIFDFELTVEELAAIDALDTGHRGGPEPEDITLETFSLEIAEA